MNVYMLHTTKDTDAIALRFFKTPEAAEQYKLDHADEEWQGPTEAPVFGDSEIND